MKTVQDILTGLRAVVAGREDYKYESPDPCGAGYCVYSTPTGEPSCGVGAYFFANDKDLFSKVHDLEWAEDEHSQPMVLQESNVKDLEGKGLLGDYGYEAVQLLAQFQRSQDRGVSWGNALLSTEALAGRLVA